MLKVILVDDEERILSGLKKIIDWESNGFSVAGAFSDSEEALDKAIELQPHLIIVDIEMPGLSGLELIEKLRDSLPYTKFVILSAHDQFEYAQKAIHFGVSRYLLKPIDNQELIDVLKDVRIEVSDRIKEIEQRMKMQLDKELHHRSLKSQIVREAICDGLIRKGKDKPDLYDQISHSFSFSLCFVQLRIPLDENFKYKLCSEACFDSVAAHCTDKLNCTVVFRREDCLVLVLKEAEEKVDNNELLKQLEDIAGLPVMIGLSSVFTGLTQAHSYFLKSFSYFKNIIFFKENTSFFYIPVDESNKGEDLSLILQDAKKRLPSILFESDIEEYTEYSSEIYKQLLGLRNRTTPEIIHGFYQTLINYVRRVCSTISRQDQEAFSPVAIPQFKYLSDYHKYVSYLIIEDIKKRAQLYGDASASIVNQVKLYIHENYAKSDLKLNKIADEYYINYSYLSYLFKKKTGTNFSSYLTEIRIEEAKKLLRHSSLSINEVAKRVGYQNYQNFYYAFQKSCGISPNSYRQEFIE
jgi:two-component system response regulator YesN